MSGYAGDLSDAQAASLAQLKAALADVLQPSRHDDRYLLRFLRARHWNVGKAEDMFRATLVFRAKWKLDTILQDYKPPQVLLEYFPWGYLEGLDNTGHVIDWNSLGNMDGKGLVLSTSIEEMTRYKLWRIEQAESRTLITNNLQITVVTDLHNLSSRHLYRPALKFFADTEKMVEDYYPEFIYKVLIIRPPAIFNLLYSMVKHVFEAETLAKFEVVPGDPLPRLLEHFSKDVIPVSVGGLREYKDPLFLCFGGRVPESYYKVNDDTYEKVTVAAGAAHVHRLVVDQPGSTLAWDFFTTDNDISFGVYFVPSGADEGDRTSHRVVVPLERVNAHTDRMASTVATTDLGVYHLVWDNSYSWVTAKALNYKAEVVGPNATA